MWAGNRGGGCKPTKEFQKGRETAEPQLLEKAGSKSNTGDREIESKKACQKVGKINHKSEDISESVNSFDSGAIFRSSLSEDISRNVFVVSIYAP